MAYLYNQVDMVLSKYYEFSKNKYREVYMKRLAMALTLCLVIATIAYGQTVKDVTSAVQDKATSVAKDTAKAVVDDSSITAEVKAKILTTTSLKDAKIEVSTTDGVVSMTGVVKTKQAKGAATKIAKAVKGVKSIDNQLTIEPPAKKVKKTTEKK
jgi:hyperosmotically inducible periplasmic protein